MFMYLWQKVHIRLTCKVQFFFIRCEYCTQSSDIILGNYTLLVCLQSALSQKLTCKPKSTFIKICRSVLPFMSRGMNALVKISPSSHKLQANTVKSATVQHSSFARTLSMYVSVRISHSFLNWLWLWLTHHVSLFGSFRELRR